MAPEQASGKHADLRVDIYAVGIIMYEMFTGAVPFTGDTFLGVLTKHLSEPPPPMHGVFPELSISAELQAVIMRALVKDPAVRYQTMLEFGQAITGTPDAAALGYRQMPSSLAERSMSYLPHAPSNPTHQQFAPATPPRPSVQTPSPGRATPSGPDTAAARAETLVGAEANTRSAPGRGDQLGTCGQVARAGSRGFGSQCRIPTRARKFCPSAGYSCPDRAVRLNVSSEPSSAVLLKNGFQVCDATPCEVLATPNETLVFQATKGALKGSVKVLAQRDQKVAIGLAAASPPAPVRHDPQRLCELEVDGLKSFAPANKARSSRSETRL